MVEITAPAEPFQEAGADAEGLLDAWLVAERDTVTDGQPIADAIVVKAAFQVTAPCAGTVTRIVVPAGDTFAAGAVLALIEPFGT